MQNYLKTIQRYSKLPVSFCLAIKFVFNFFFKDFTFFTFFTSMDILFQFLMVRTRKVRPPSAFFLKIGQWKFKNCKKFALFNDIVKEEGQCHWTRNTHWGFYLLFSWAVQGPLPLHTENDVSFLFERPDLSQNSKCNCLVGTEVLPALSNRQLKNRKGNLKKSFSK